MDSPATCEKCGLPSRMPVVSVLICTYRRPQRLAKLLDDIAAQTHPPNEVVVVDNHDQASAREVVLSFAAAASFPVRYEVQPVKNISLTRNRTVALAEGDWLALIDDDERPSSTWLQTHLEMAAQTGADGVLGPVMPLLPADAPDWIRRGTFYEYGRGVTGEPVSPGMMWINNALLRGDMLRSEPGPFDPRFGLTGGEDSDMMTRLAVRGFRMVWCEEAAVSEAVEPSRLNLRWIVLRAISGGQDYATLFRLGRFGRLRPWSMPLFFLRALLQCIVALGLSLLCLFAGRHRAVYWLRKAGANAGKLSALAGWRYREYADSAAAKT